MNLQDVLNAIHTDFASKMPDLAAQFDEDTDELVRRGVGGDGPNVGDTSPDFELSDQLGRNVRSVDLREKGPLVVAFYRGNW